MLAGLVWMVEVSLREIPQPLQRRKGWGTQILPNPYIDKIA
jgi:hypothetical protein